MKKVLTIAGSDSSGGAGIQADIKTITVHKKYAMSVITALTAQNTLGVSDIMNVPPGFVKAQMDSVFTDIFPDSVKIGMVSSQDIICAIAEKLTEYNAKNIVVDPVMISTSGSKLLFDDDISTLTSKLIPIADLITPNIPEAEVLCQLRVKNKNDMLKATEVIFDKYKTPVLIKGGHISGTASDLLFDGNEITWFEEKRIDNPNNHGTGCTLSSAIACNLAEGLPLKDSIFNAKKYLTGTLLAQLNLGKSSGPLMHNYNIM